MKRVSKGGISKKTIHGKTYYYHQWYEDGKRKSRILSEKEAKQFQENAALPSPYQSGDKQYPGIYVFEGEALKTAIASVKDLKPRDCFQTITSYLGDAPQGKMLVLFGLRRTGKTTLMLQAIAQNSDTSTSAYITCSNGATMSDLCELLQLLTDKGIKNFYIDEITIAKGFIEGAAFLADVYARLGHVVLTGADSLAFSLLGKDELYDRMTLVHTTYMPYKEYAAVSKVPGIDAYLQRGGTFADDDHRLKHQEYIDSAIADNLYRSLVQYHEGSILKQLHQDYGENGLLHLVNHVILDLNHHFLQSVIDRRFLSQDFGPLKGLPAKEKDKPELAAFLKGADEEDLYARLTEALAVVKGPLKLDEEDMEQARRYLKAIDVLEEVDRIVIESGKTQSFYVFTQPSMRFLQCQELIEELLKQEDFADLSAIEASYLQALLFDDVQSKMLEEIALLDGKRRGLRCFKALFSKGEFDMAIYDEKSNVSKVYEIKHSDHVIDAKRKSLSDPSLIKAFQKRFGVVKKKMVLYRGEDQTVGEIKYRNIERFLLR